MPDLIIKLKKPIKVQSENGFTDITEVRLREPSLEDGFSMELPFDIQTGRLDKDNLKLWVSRLSGYGGDVFSAMRLSHMMKIANWLAEEAKPDEGN